ncbi:MAG: hypothetical protein EXS52_01935 [Candidatus Staskawiczbacteria bacterium]|nr:hypothetical protein [Candidatus Staskawiczbacteria bacterium]
MSNKKPRKNLKKKQSEKIENIYQNFLDRMKKLQGERDKLVNDFLAHADKKEVEKLKKGIDSLYK